MGRAAQELGIRDALFLATKVDAMGREAGLRQIERSFRDLRTNRIDLLAVHNLRDTATQLRTLRELKESGRIRYVGVTVRHMLRRYNDPARFQAAASSSSSPVLRWRSS